MENLIYDIGHGVARAPESKIKEAQKLVEKYPNYKGKLNDAIGEYEVNHLGKLIKLIKGGQYNRSTIEDAQELAKKHTSYASSLEKAIAMEEERRKELPKTPVKFVDSRQKKSASST